MRPALIPFLMIPAAAVMTTVAAQQSTPERRAAEQRAAERAAQRTVTITRSPEGVVVSAEGGRDRAWLGIATGSGGKRDSLGVLVQSVSPDSPAEKAGLEEGNRLQAINGVDLKLDAADAGEPELTGMMQRRLSRELGKAKPGDELELRVWANGSVKSMKVKTGAPEDVMGESFRSMRDNMKHRAVLGVGLGSSGSKRDTLGVFITSVSDGGPADKAGIGEGDRISAIDGTDLRVPREDAGDAALSSSRVNRLTKALRAKKPGDEVTLKLFSNGRTRDVKVTLGKAEDLGGSGMQFYFGDEGQGFTMPSLSLPRLLMPRVRIRTQGGGAYDEDELMPMAPMAPMRMRVGTGTISI